MSYNFDLTDLKRDGDVSLTRYVDTLVDLNGGAARRRRAHTRSRVV